MFLDNSGKSRTSVYYILQHFPQDWKKSGAETECHLSCTLCQKFSERGILLNYLLFEMKELRECFSSI